MREKLALVILIVSLGLHAYAQGTRYAFQDTAIAPDQRIDDLLGRLSADEKISQLLYNSPAIERLGIPEYNWWNECLHGVGRAGKATVFPQAIGLAATFDDDLIQRIADAISTEARAKYNVAVSKNNRGQYMGLTFWTPNINIFRDPRWGRGQETYGEDPYLTGRMGSAFVRGLQGNDPKYLKAAACAKHFAVHSGPEKTRHHFNALPSEKDLRETYLPAFKTLVDGGVEAVMCAYNRLYDEPCCGSGYLLNDILRKEWGFRGHVVTDCWALDDIWLRHKVVDTREEAAAMAAKAGANVNCGYIYKHLGDAITKGMVRESILDTLLRPLLKTRFRLGMFDPPGSVPFSAIGPDTVNCAAHRVLAYEAAVKSIVLLQNKNNLLPLNRDSIPKIFVAGPTAADIPAMVGNYNGWSGHIVTFLEGIVQAVDAGTTVDYVPGCQLNTTGGYYGFWEANLADVVVLCLGNTRLLEGEEGEAMLNPDGGDRTDIRLPRSQREYLALMKEKVPGKPIVAVVTGGSAIALQEVLEVADAVLFAWYPGEQGGTALADILFGKVNPSGKLPVTFYPSTEDLPPFDDYSMEGRTYKFFQGEPLFPFGFGLSYSKFECSNLTTDKFGYLKDEKIQITMTISNNGPYDGEDVIMLFATQISGQEPPESHLVDFRRISLKAGEVSEVKMDIDLLNMYQWDNIQNQYFVRIGEYLISPDLFNEMDKYVKISVR